MRQADSVTVSTVVTVDAHEAFRLFTAEIGAWWRRDPAYRFRPNASGTMRIEPGVGGRVLELYREEPEDAYVVGEVREWDPPRRLVFSWRGPNFEPDQVTEVDVRFETAHGGTRVTVCHRGWDGLPHDHPVRHGLDPEVFTRAFSGWWSALLARLRRLPTERPTT